MTPPPVCGSISDDVSQDCDNPMVAGTKDRLILLNFSDLDSVSKNANPLIIEDMLLASGTEAFQYDGKNNSNGNNFELIVKDFAEVYKHKLPFKVFKNDGATKQQLELLAKGRVIAIVENNHKGSGGDAAFEILGLDSGLVLTVHTRDANDDPTQGAHDLMLESSDKSLEPHVPVTFFSVDYATTKALIDALLVV